MAPAQEDPTPIDLDLDLRIRCWIYENVGPLFIMLPELDENADTEPQIRFRETPLDREMTKFSASLEAVESLLELFPVRDPERVEAERKRLFFAERGVAAPPSASWYLDGKANGPATEWVAEHYRAQGLDVADSEEPCDFVSTEFEFMEHMCRLELGVRTSDDPEQLERIVEAQRVFALEHLTRWLPHFARAIRKSEPSPLFARVARVLEVFSEEEAAHFG